MHGRKVEYFFTHTLQLSTVESPEKKQQVEHIFAKVKWFGRHPRAHQLPYPLLVVTTVFENEGPASIIPLSRIVCRCGISIRTTVKFDYGEDNVYIITPYFQKHVLMPNTW